MLLRNYYSLRAYSLFSMSLGSVTPANGDNAVSYGSPNIKSIMQTRQTSYTSGAGVVFGTGDTTPTADDIKLSGSLVTTFTSSYSQTTGIDDQGPYVRTLYTLTNTGSAAVTIKEIGLLAQAASSVYVLVERTVLDKPVTIAGSKGVGQIEYIVHYDTPKGDTSAFDSCADSDVYGVEWDMSSTSALTRIGGAAAFSSPSPATSLTASGSSPFDAVQPWAGMKRYNIIGGAVSYSEDDSGFSEKDYDTVVYIPEFWYRCAKEPYNSKWRWAISPVAKDGFEKHPGSGRYVGRYHTSGSSSAVYSKSGSKPLVSTPRPNFRTYSHNKGDKWWMIDIEAWSAIQLLYLVEFANWDSQTILGTGQVSGSRATVGGTDGAVYHTVKRNGSSNQYRWLEDLWSNCYDWVDGMTFSSQVAYICEDNANSGDTTANHMSSGCTVPNGGYIQNYFYCESFPWVFLPSKISNNNNGYIPDYVYSNSPCVYVGGYYSSSADRGLFSLDCSAASYSGGYIGSRLLYIP